MKSPDRNDLDPYNPQYEVAIDLSSKLYWSKLISILFKIRDVVYVQITNISLASRLSCRSRSLTAVTSHRLASEIRRTLSGVIILYMHLNGLDSSGLDTCMSKCVLSCRLVYNLGPEYSLAPSLYVCLSMHLSVCLCLCLSLSLSSKHIVSFY